MGIFLFCYSAAFLFPFALAAYYQFWASPSLHPQPHTTLVFFLSFLCSLAIAGAFSYLGKKSSGRIYRREGLAIVVLMWFLLPAISAIPFVMSHTLKNPFAAYFEMVSGLTTTGATAMQAKEYDPDTGKEVPIVTTICGSVSKTYSYLGTIEPVRDPVTGTIIVQGIEAVSKSLLFWRSFIQWLGGGGIVVLFIAILPALGAGGKLLFHTEVPGPIKDTFTPRIKETAIQIWKIYIGFTILQPILLLATNANMDWLDAITITFSTLSTGGFSIRNASIGSYNNANTDWVIIVFMIIGSMNFSLFFYCLQGKFYRLYERELIIYICVIAVFCFIVAYSLVGAPKQLLTGEPPTGVYSLHEAIRHGTFQIVSAISTTGFSSVNFDIWPFIGQVAMMIVMYIGGMSGSTAGGIKIIRHYMLFRIFLHKVETLFRPETVRSFRIGDKEVDASVTTTVLVYFFLTIFLSVAGTFIYVMDGLDPETSIGLVSCMVNDTGLAFRAAGPLESCAFLSDFGYLLSSALMIFGRLEFFAVFAILVPSFWRQDQ
jgi:trk system potassium uptake protein TrkH